MFKMVLKTDNDAFRNPSSGKKDKFWETEEIIRILNETRKQLESGKTYGTIMDVSGNKVGYWER